MNLETRLLFERGIGILEAISISAPAGMQEALTIAVQMFDKALVNTPITQSEERG